MDGHALRRLGARRCTPLAHRLPHWRYHRPLPSSLVLVPLSLLAAAGLYWGAPVVAERATDEAAAALERQAFDSLAAARAREGLPPLQFRGDALRVARSHSRDMARRAYFSHYTPERLGPGGRLDAAGIPWTRYGEDVARVRGARTSEAVVAAWLASPENRANALAPDLTGGAIGVACAEDGVYHVTLVMLRP